MVLAAGLFTVARETGLVTPTGLVAREVLITETGRRSAVSQSISNADSWVRRAMEQFTTRGVVCGD